MLTLLVASGRGQHTTAAPALQTHATPSLSVARSCGCELEPADGWRVPVHGPDHVVRMHVPRVGRWQGTSGGRGAVPPELNADECGVRASGATTCLYYTNT